MTHPNSPSSQLSPEGQNTMKNDRHTAGEIRDLLSPGETPVPPPDLLERICTEIPDELELPPAASLSRASPQRRLRRMALAASLLAAAGAAFFLLRQPDILEQAEPELVEQTARPGAEEDRAFVDFSHFGAEGASVGDERAAPGDGEAPAARNEIPQPEPAQSITRGDAESTEHQKLKDQAHLQTPSGPSLRELESRMEMLRARPSPEPSPKADREETVARAPRRQGSRALGSAAESTIAAGGRLQSGRAETPSPTETALIDERRTPAASLAPVPPWPVPPPAIAPPSTGGDSEPNDAPYGDVFFRDYGTNPFIDTEDDRLSTFGLDVDTASYTVVRRFLSDGHLPDPAAVRVEELINYFDYGDAPPAEEDFRIHATGSPSPFGEGERYHLLRFHLRGRDLSDAERRPSDLVFVVDVSGSMARENRLGLVKDALGLLLGELRADDRVALVVYGDRGRVIQEYTTDRALLRRAIDRLAPGGSTNAAEGLDLAYELAARERRRGTTSRVILCSDGVANVGATSAEAILERIRGHAERGVELTTVGFGMGNYNDVLMERLADSGNGRYAYVDQLGEARRIFVEGLTGTLQTLAAEARVQVEWNDELVSRYRLIGYENRDIADERFRDDTVDAGEIGAGHAVTALYEIKTRRDLRPRDRVATLRLRYASVIADEMVELERRVSGRDFVRRFEDAPASLRLTALVAEFGEILSHSYWAREGSLGEVMRRAQRISPEFPGDTDVAEFVSLVGKAARLSE